MTNAAKELCEGKRWEMSSRGEADGSGWIHREWKRYLPPEFEVAKEVTRIIRFTPGPVTSRKAKSDPLSPILPGTGTVATLHHSLLSLAAFSASPRPLWQLTFQSLRNRESPKILRNLMLRAGEGGPSPLFRGIEEKERVVSVKRRFGRPNEIELRFRLLFV